jgi:hypothetical protein
VAHTERENRIRIISARKPTRSERNNYEKESTEAENEWEMRDEYDFSKGIRGKYAERYARGTNLVPLDPDVAEVFPDAAAVNQALRALAAIIRDRTKSPAA